MTENMTQAAGKAEGETRESTHGARVYRPLTDIVGTSNGISLMLEIPGVASGDVDITLEKRVLTIRGKVQATQSDALELAHAEYGEGDFERAFTLSEDLDPAGIEAEMRNGVLTVKLPRAEAAQPRKIAIKAV